MDVRTGTRVEAAGEAQATEELASSCSDALLGALIGGHRRQLLVPGEAFGCGFPDPVGELLFR